MAKEEEQSSASKKSPKAPGLAIDRAGLVIITGASRGFGRALAECLWPRVGSGSRFVLMASPASAERLGKLLQELRDSSSSSISGTSIPLDLATADYAQLSEALDSAIDIDDGQRYEYGLLIQNAATLGQLLARAEEFTDKAGMDRHWAMNITSTYLLNAYCLGPLVTKGVCKRWFVMNISSLLALQSMPTMSLYATAKAARDMVFKALCHEIHGDDAAANGSCIAAVLNYAPGPLDTDMQLELRESTPIADMRAMWQQMLSEGGLLTAAQSADKFVDLIVRGGYEQGQHIDYFDLK